MLKPISLAAEKKWESIELKLRLIQIRTLYK